MNHSFNVEAAKKFSVDEAIMLEFFYFWIQKNKANKRHFYDGRYWTYNSQEALSILLPYWSRRQIQRILKQLEDHGLLVKGSYNKSAYDRTLWYGLTEKSLHVLENKAAPNGAIGGTESCDQNDETVQPIPVNIPFSNTVKSIVEYLNSKAGTSYKPTTGKTQTCIRARLNEGFTEDDFKRVIDIKTAEWLDTDMAKFLRPETLFGNKFEGYLNQKKKKADPYEPMLIV